MQFQKILVLDLIKPYKRNKKQSLSLFNYNNIFFKKNIKFNVTLSELKYL